MKLTGNYTSLCLIAFLSILQPLSSSAATRNPYSFSFSFTGILFSILFGIVLILFVLALILKQKANAIRNTNVEKPDADEHLTLQESINNFDSSQINKLLSHFRKKSEPKKPNNNSSAILPVILLLGFLLIFSNSSSAQENTQVIQKSIFSEPGIIITIILILIPILGGIILLMMRLNRILTNYRNKQTQEKAEKLVQYFSSLPAEELENVLQKRKDALDFNLKNDELSGTEKAEDGRGLLKINTSQGLPIVAIKKKAVKRPNIDPALSKLIIWYIVSSTFWLLFGTTVGEYLGIKFLAPDADHLSWLSFGRLRPVHTNAVFWGWASLGMLGMGYYIVPTVSNTKLASIKLGWYTLILINAAVLFGSLSLMAGINNGGGEYREYIWPIMLLFGIGLALTLFNFLKTIARRLTKEIYIANWYIVSAIIFTIVISIVAYTPYWQNGLGETIVQGYYMHQGVGMWFMLFTLGIVYYFLPQQLNKPIYSYSLGILAFWTQILFYTLIGSHHFVFSSIPWWLQTIAIIGSVGMIIPVVAGTTNFLLTFKGAWGKISDSYTLPFFLVGIIFYFTGSMQGTAEAFRTTNLVWHFTDFTVAHSHITMYGIICFFLWASMYAVIPRLTGNEAPQITIGAHFWLALIGLLFYTIPLMYGSTLKGMTWLEGKPFIESVVLMAPYWLWRAIGGSLMWLSHIFFAYNLYKMIVKKNDQNVAVVAINQLTENNVDSKPV